MKPRILVLLIVLVAGCDDNGTAPQVDPAPVFVASWGLYGSDEGRLHQPTGICFDLEGNILVADAQNLRVQKFTRDGDFLQVYGRGELNRPLGVAVGPDGVVYVNDFFNTRIKRFAANGEYLGAWDYISAPYGPVVDRNNNVYISGSKVIARVPTLVTEGPAIWKLAADGTELAKYDSHGVSTIAIDPVGTIWGLFRYHDEDRLPHTVVVMMRHGELLGGWELNEDISTAADAIVLVNGNVYVTARDLGKGFVYKLSKSGRLLAKWSEVDGFVEPLGWPAGLAIDENENIFVVDFTRDRIVEYGYPP